MLSPAMLPPYPESLSSNACSRAALSDVDPDPTVTYWGRLDARGTLSFVSPADFPLPLYSWLMVLVESSVGSRAVDVSCGVDDVDKEFTMGRLTSAHHNLSVDA